MTGAYFKWKAHIKVSEACPWEDDLSEEFKDKAEQEIY